jgi:hypothetical protein
MEGNMNRGSFELSVAINRDGRATPLREFGHNGNTYIESRDGQKFTIKFKNNRAHRVLVVPSIDGLSVLEGTPATPQSRGYIVPAYSSVEIKGWRTSLEDINDFVFERKDKSYVAGTGNDTANCGVIGLKVFAEKEKPRTITQIVREEHHHHHHDLWPWIEPTPPWRPSTPWRPYWHRDILYGSTTCAAQGEVTRSVDPTYTAGAMGAQGPVGSMGDPGEPLMCFMNSVAEPEFTSDQTLGTSEKYEGGVKKGLISAQVPQFDMGTAYGAHQKDKVTEEVFERGADLETMMIYYASAKALAEIGIDVEKKVAVNVMPQAFAAGFCKAPVTR